MKIKSKHWLIAFTAIIALFLATCDNGNSNGKDNGDDIPTQTVNYGLYVHSGDNTIRRNDASGAAVNLNGISWNRATRTLTLNNFSFETSAAIALLFDCDTFDKLFTIELNGTNTIRSVYNNLSSEGPVGIGANGSIAIQGSGLLTVISGRASQSAGILLAHFMVLPHN
jgi:hypothetical protein